MVTLLHGAGGFPGSFRLPFGSPLAQIAGFSGHSGGQGSSRPPALPRELLVSFWSRCPGGQGAFQTPTFLPGDPPGLRAAPAPARMWSRLCLRRNPGSACSLWPELPRPGGRALALWGAPGAAALLPVMLLRWVGAGPGPSLAGSVHVAAGSLSPSPLGCARLRHEPRETTRTRAPLRHRACFRGDVCYDGACRPCASRSPDTGTRFLFHFKPGGPGGTERLRTERVAARRGVGRSPGEGGP